MLQADPSHPPALTALVEEILAKRVSMFDLIRSAPPGDYFAHVQRHRLYTMLSGDRRVLAVLVDEVNERIRAAGHHPGIDQIGQELARKDGRRRFLKLAQLNMSGQDDRRSLLTGTDWETCLAQYKRLIGHVENLWAEACQLFTSAKYPLAAFLAILTVEEIGKLSGLWSDLVVYDAPRPEERATSADRDHRRKHFIAVMSGALINARLDRVLGKNVIRKVLHEAESDEFEKMRQACLYIDIADGQVVTPAERVREDRARTLVVLAGELMAEVLGHFPWEFERMLGNVIAFEREIGIPEKKIRQN